MGTIAGETRIEGQLRDLNARVDDGFKAVRTESRYVRAETNDRFEALQRTRLQFLAGMSVAITIGSVGVITAILVKQ